MFRFKTKCPRCRREGEFFSDDADPVANCGDCLMDDIEIVRLECTPDAEITTSSLP
jgi:hypothetical protein